MLTRLKWGGIGAEVPVMTLVRWPAEADPASTGDASASLSSGVPRWLTVRGELRVVGQVALVMALVEGVIMALIPVLALPHATEVVADPLLLMAVGAPLIAWLVVRPFIAQLRGMYAEITDQERRRVFEGQLRQGFEMAYDEESAIEVTRRALELICPSGVSDLLLADAASGRLRSVVAVPSVASSGATADAGTPSCPVRIPGSCPAIVSGVAQRFEDPEAIHACPQLRLRTSPVRAAACLPVSSMGRALGVLHVTTDDARILDRATVHRLGLLASQAGAGVGMRRSFSWTQSQADTDVLTGLLNRRALAERSGPRLAGCGEYAVVMMDLDHFKRLNDAHGHEAGDRALRTAARTVKGIVRSVDLVARYGGEEFVLLLPGMDVVGGVKVAERIREGLALAATADDAPSTTASFGVTGVAEGTDVWAAVREADLALLAAKQAGRNQVRAAALPAT
jgi:diguanylate cyclase (GGDEF)-like protein